MGIFGRQWLLKIRFCCHDSDYLTGSGSETEGLPELYLFNLLMECVRKVLSSYVMVAKTSRLERLRADGLIYTMGPVLTQPISPTLST